MRAAQRGRDDEAVRLWNRILAIDPGHLRTPERARTDCVPQRRHAIGTDGVPPHRRGRRIGRPAMDPSRDHVPESERRAGTGSGGPARAQPRSHRPRRADPAREPAREAGKAARGRARLQRRSERRAAASQRLRPELRPAVSQALAYADKVQQRNAARSSTHISSRTSRDFAGENLKRFRDSVDIMVGRKKRFDSQSMTLSLSEPRADRVLRSRRFPWLDPIEAATDEIRRRVSRDPRRRRRVHAVHHLSAGRAAQPVGGARTIRRAGARSTSTRWGSSIEENAAKCPTTMRSSTGTRPSRISRAARRRRCSRCSSRRRGFRRTPA